MAQKFVVRVEYRGEIQDVTIRPKSFKEYEKKFDQTFNEFSQNPSMTGTFWLAWHSLMLLGDVDAVGGFEKWMDDLDSVETVEEGQEHPKDLPTPTQDTSSN